MAKPSPTLANAYEDIDTMANYLDLQNKNSDTTDKAKQLFNVIHRSKELKGCRNHHFTSSCLYIACR